MSLATSSCFTFQLCNTILTDTTQLVTRRKNVPGDTLLVPQSAEVSMYCTIRKDLILLIASPQPLYKILRITHFPRFNGTPSFLKEAINDVTLKGGLLSVYVGVFSSKMFW
ncbi:hypothetical protein JTE90_018549 [Oedothorax gibbosus]|uniref:Uncharacterized protein n=1 Tax=Oedothorax gibbosus TaxID=931172 RepID=A0AAV6V4H5_9ARAC|nr:hypothetical protein JTE90_018549 [Oedothorax gibbosus]